MKRYSKYKDSGVEWIGNVPFSWSVMKYKHFYRSNMGETILKENLVDNGKLPVYSATEGDDIFGYVNDSKVILESGDLIIPARGNSIGHIMLVKEPCTTTQTTIYSKKSSKHQLLDDFTFYYLKGLRQHLFQFDRTAIPQITVSQVKENIFLLPDITEQQAIVSFLDDKTSQIDTLISNSQKKIELLKEKRTALINHAVTKGLDPKAKMKDSGVEWIGEIPEGWGIVQLNHIASKITNGFVGPTRDILVGSGVKYIQGIHLKNDYIRYTPDGDYYVTQEWSINHSRSILKEGDVLLVQSGSIGEIGYVTKEFEGSNCHALIIVQFEPTIMSGKYFMYQLKSNYAQSFLQSIKTGEILQHLNTTKVKYYKSINPPIEVQLEIVEYLDHHTSEIDKEVSLEEKRIELLKEYRQSLISEVVTGKINVSDYAVQPN